MQQIGRRGFLNWLGIGGIAPLFKLVEKPAVPSCPPLREIMLLETFIAGFQFHEGVKPEVFGELKTGAPLTLNRESGNAYDRNAIAMHTIQGNHVGYIPRTENQMLARMLDQGTIIVGRVAGVDCDAPAWERVALRLFVNAPAATVGEGGA